MFINACIISFYHWIVILFMCLCVVTLAPPLGLQGLNSLAKAWTQGHDKDSAESWPLDCQGSPRLCVLISLSLCRVVLLHMKFLVDSLSSSTVNVISMVSDEKLTFSLSHSLLLYCSF